jgi:cbb3-type cytochrome oxidase maturation protein
MSVLFIALPIALLLAGLALWGFIRAVSSGQFDDLDTPAHRILHDDTPPKPKAKVTEPAPKK